MRRSILILVVAFSFLAVQSAQAQLKGLGGAIGRASDSAKKVTDKADEKKKQVDKVTSEFDLTEADEISVGQQLSAKICAKYGVVQDPQIHKYVGLIGAVLAKKSSRSTLPWTFIVLDTDGVNAFAAPGGFIHISRGALALMQTEAEVAGVLGHEMSHVTRKHTIKAIQKGKLLQFGESKTSLKDDPQLFQKAVDLMFDAMFAGFGREDELDADHEGVPLTAQAGYAPFALSQFLRTLDQRNKDSDQKQGLFASHPEIAERLKKIDEEAAKDKSGALATLAARFTANVKYKPVPISALAVNDTGQPAAAAPAAAEKKPEEKKSRFSISSITSKNPLGGGSDKQSASVTGSAGYRGLDRERAAKGGDNPKPVPVMLTAAEIAAFISEGKLTA
jgi:predicted Zn-dependent protease